MLLSFTPVVRSSKVNAVRIYRTVDINTDEVMFAATGPYAGVMINKFAPNSEPFETHVDCNFSLCMRNVKTGQLQQEVRTLRFRFEDGLLDEVRRNYCSSQFINNLMCDLPPDYANFFIRLLRMLKSGFHEIVALEVETKVAESNEEIAIPDVNTLDVENEIEELTMGHVQELLERAYPNGLTFDTIVDVLRCDNDEEIETFLGELENMGIVKRCGDEWIRAQPVSLENNRPQSSVQRPTIAIITCLFVEKLAVDAIIEDAQTVHKYKSGGDSNIYTIGKVGKHAVVATKLAVIGDSREATISAGSITTRLLGNFQHVEHVFILGIGGGVPHFTSTNNHVRRGDVVVSYAPEGAGAYCYAHSFKRNRDEAHNVVSDVNLRQWGPKSNDLAHVIEKFTDDDVSDWQKGTNRLILELMANNPDTNFNKPLEDQLALPVSGGGVVVVNHPDDRCESLLHLAPVGAICSIRNPTKGADGANPDDSVVSNASVEAENERLWDLSVQETRQQFIGKEHLRALDAGFDSVIAAIEGSRIDSWAVVLGITDYSQGNSRGAQEWKPYAAANAASLLREAILRFPK